MTTNVNDPLMQTSELNQSSNIDFSPEKTKRISQIGNLDVKLPYFNVQPKENKRKKTQSRSGSSKKDF